MKPTPKPSVQIAMMAREERRPGQVSLLPDIRHVVRVMDAMHERMEAQMARIEAQDALIAEAQGKLMYLRSLIRRIEGDDGG